MCGEGGHRLPAPSPLKAKLLAMEQGNFLYLSRRIRSPKARLLAAGAGAWLVFALLSGCAVGPDFRPPSLPLPEKYHGLDPKAPERFSHTLPEPQKEVEWWRAFRDPILEKLVSMALTSNLDLKQAEARIRQARAARGMAASGLFPRLEASALYERSKSAGATLREAGGVPLRAAAPFRELFQVGLDAAWELDLFGGTRRSVEAAGAEVQAAVEDRREVLVSLVGEVGTTYLNLRGFQQEIRIARRNLEAQKKTAEITRRRFEAGFVSRLDVANAEAQVATTEAQIPLLEAQAQAAIYGLGVLLGQQPAYLAEALATPTPLPPTPPEVPVGLPSELLRRRPDIRRAEARLHAATARIGVAVAELFPRFSLTGNLGLAANEVRQLGTADSRFWSFGAGLTTPLFAGGKIYWNIQRHKALEEEAFLEYEKTVLKALKEVETALVAYAREQEHYKSLAAAVAHNRQAVELAMKLYVAGKTDFLNVLNAQRALLQTEEALVQSTRNLGTHLIALYKALGGGWEAGIDRSGTPSPACPNSPGLTSGQSPPAHAQENRPGGSGTLPAPESHGPDSRHW